MSLAAFNIEKAKDADGRVIEPVLEFHAGAIRWAVQYIVLDGDLLNFAPLVISRTSGAQ